MFLVYFLLLYWASAAAGHYYLLTFLFLDVAAVYISLMLLECFFSFGKGLYSYILYFTQVRLLYHIIPWNILSNVYLVISFFLRQTPTIHTIPL